MPVKPRPRFLMMSFSIVAVLILILSACGSSGSSSSSSTSSAGTPVKGGTWIEDLFEEPDSLIPNFSTETFANIVMDGLYAGLIYGDPQGKLLPGLATEVPTTANGGVSSDLKTVTFHLRPGLKWSDGQPLDARDVDFSWKLWANPKAAAYNTIPFAAIQSADVSSDNLTITFHLKTPYVSFVSQWADGGFAGPLPAHVFSSMDPGSVIKSPQNLNPQAVSGPFMMSESKPGDHYTIVRNPNYYQAAQGLPYLDKVVFRIVTDQNTILTDAQSGSIDSVWFLDVSKALAYQSLSNYQTIGDGGGTGKNSYSWSAIWINWNNKVLGGNPEVRQAMAMAVDQQSLIQIARRGFASARCQDHAPVQVPGYTASLTCPKFDLNAANALLDQHGWKLGSDGVRTKNGERLEFQYSTTAGNLWRADDQLINQANFKKIGIKLDIQNYPASTFFGPFLTGGQPSPPTGAVSGKYDIAEFVESGTYDPDNSVFLTCAEKGSGNLAFYCSQQMDALQKQQLSTGDNAARQKAFDGINQLEVTDFPFILEFGAPDLAVYKKGANNYLPSAVGIGDTENIWLWWCNNGTCPAGG
ncbi:MAG TPA: peptide ABC transporter substrate-binding protein [Ktedonobacteraceae bacterium]|nr:peptide ABC transporter substrate-binding protein [Ktedonobacteraceae bacterium]